MLKKTIILIVLLGLITFSTAQEIIKNEKKSNKFRIDELVLLPHPGKFVKNKIITITKEQKDRITKEVKTIYVPIFQDKMREAFKLEKKVQKSVAKGKTKEDLKNILDKIEILKREAINARIDALNQIRKILSKEQWDKVNKLTYK